MPNWDDQFDFDDIDNDKGKAKPVPKTKKTTNNDDQFFDQQNSGSKKDVKSILPTINTRNSAKSTKPLVETPKVNPFANKSFGSKQMTQEDFEQDFQQEVVQQPKPKQQPITLTVTKPNQPKNKNQKKQDEYDEQFYEEQLEEPLQKSVYNKNKSKNSQKVLSTQPSNTVTKTQPQSIKPLQTQNKQTKQQQNDEYEEEDFDNDEYGDDDFEQEAKSPVKKAVAKVNQLIDNIQSKSNPKLPIKTQQTSKDNQPTQKYTSTKPSTKQQIPPKGKQVQTRSQSVVPPKPPGGNKNNKETTVSSRNINKLESQSVSKPMKRSASKQSIRSNGDKSIKASRISERNQSQFLPNKHLGLVSKSFPHDEDKINQLGQLQINKMNEKMRAMIRKFNEELNDLINKNMFLLKNKSINKHTSLEQRIRELQIQKKSGDTAIEVMQKDFDKLQGRQGELREEEYQLILQKQVQQIKTKIKQSTKQITVIKREVDNRGKKLSQKQADQHNAQNIHHLKTNIIQARKQQQKGDQRIQKLTSNYEQLQTKISDIQYKLDELISDAKEKGVNIQNTDHINKKHEDLKNKLENIKNFNTKSQNLNNTKLEILNHENDLVRISIRNITSQISNLYGSIDHSQSEAIKLIEKAKERAGINPLFAESLQKLLKQLEDSRSSNDHDYYDARSEIKSRRSDSTKNRGQKVSNQEIQKSMPLRVTHSQNRLLQNQDHSSVKPKFLKKKPVEQAKLEIENKSKVNERVWNQDSQSNNSKASVNDQNEHKVASPTHQNKNLTQESHKNDSTKEISEQDKKDKSKPFMIKKNKPAEGKVEQVKEKVVAIEEKVNVQLSLPSNPKNNEEPKKQENVNINLAPRMMKFNRKKNNEDEISQNNISHNDNPTQKQISKPIELSLQKKDNNAKLSHNLGGEKNTGLSLQISEPPKKTEEEPIFVPKRFNLRGKVDKKDDSYVPNVVQKDNSYTSSVENKAIVQKLPVQKEEKKEEYQPKFNFKDEEPIKNPFKKEPQQPILPVEQPQPEIKPRFNLRLRDKQTTNNDSYEPSKVIEPQLNMNANVQSSVKSGQLNIQTESKPAQNQFIAPKQNIVKANDIQIQKNNPYNPYAPKVQPQVGIKLNVEPNKDIVQTENINSNNPYASKFQSGSQEPALNEAPKKQKGPLKKNKISTNVPKQSFNIYAQADDITNEVKEIGAKTVNQNPYNVATNNPVPVKNESQKLNLNDMLGIKKEVKKNDFSDLLEDVGVANTKNKKKNNDFFNDLDF